MTRSCTLLAIAMVLHSCSGMSMPSPPTFPPPPGTSLPVELMTLYGHTLEDNAGGPVFGSISHRIKAIDIWFDNCNIDMIPAVGNNGRVLMLTGADGSGGTVAFGDTFFAGSLTNPHQANFDTLFANRQAVPQGDPRGVNNFPTRTILVDGLSGVVALGIAPQSQNLSVVNSTEDQGRRSIVLAHEIGHELSLLHVDSSLVYQFVMHPNADLSGDLIPENVCLLAQQAGRNLNYFE